MDNYYNCP